VSATRGGRGVLYLLVFAAGAVIGLVGGGEAFRRIYRAAAPQPSPADTAVAAPVAAQPSAAEVQEEVRSSRETALVRATRAVSPCVVGIVVTQIQVVRSRYRLSEYFELFGSPEIRQVENMGSGVVIRDDGMILTNLHVVGDAASVVYVNFPDGRKMQATVVGLDQRTDLAVLNVKATGLQSIKLGDSDKLMIGEWVLAIGNPFLNFINDAHPTVTVGVVSALNRRLTSPDGADYRGMIQTDAAINPGNSGGPLVDALGRAIGLNTVIYTGTDEGKGWIGIGFAIPINRARRVADELIKYGRRRAVWTGVAAMALTREVALALGYDRTDGVVVTAVQPSSPGERAGLRSGDILLAIGGVRIHTMEDFQAAFAELFVGDKARIEYRRRGSELSATMPLVEQPRGR